MRQWWALWPTANIAIVTGAASSGACGGASLLVIDIDGPEGEASLQALGPLPETASAKTGKGRHLYFSAPAGLKNTQGVLGLHIDTRAENGYVIAPPSLHASGARYEWLSVRPIVPVPEHVLERLAAPRPKAPTAAPAPAAPAASALPDIDSARASKSLTEHVQALVQALPGTKHATLRDAAWAHAAAAHEAHEARDAAQARVLPLLLGALSQNLSSKVENWSQAESTVLSAFEKAYSRPLAPRLQSYEQEFNEDGLARRFARAYASQAAFVPGQGWRMWDGRRWADQPGSGQPLELVSKMLIELQHELLSRDQEKMSEQIKAKKTAGTMGAILRVASRFMAVPFDAFDRDPYLLCCQNGTVDLRTGALRAHSPADLITHIAGVAYEPSARCDAFLNALSQMQRADGSAVEYLRLLFGSFCQGQALDGFWLMYGNGFDGKSTVLQVLHGVLGTYAKALNSQAIIVAKNGTRPHTSMMGGLAGARLGTIDEMPADCQLDTGAIKSYFGRLPVRLQTGMGKDFVDVVPSAKGLAASNHLPRIDEHDFGTQRRFQVIPFDANLRALGVRKDDGFPLRLLAQEGPAILAWLVSGCRDWLASGCQLPACERVAAATAELFGDGDQLGEFISRCTLGEVSCTAADLYKAYKAHAEEAGDYVLSKKGLGNRLRERGFKPYKDGKGVRMYVGIKPPAAAFAPPGAPR